PMMGGCCSATFRRYSASASPAPTPSLGTGLFLTRSSTDRRPASGGGTMWRHGATATAPAGAKADRGPVTDHPQTALRRGDQIVQVDEQMAPLLQRLWSTGVETIYSCQGDPDGVEREDLAYIAFLTHEDCDRFAARVPSDRPGWDWFTEDEADG